MEQTISIKLDIDSDDLDRAVEKANQLVGLLQEAQRIASLLSAKEESQT